MPLKIRETLVTVFALNAVFRIGLVIASGETHRLRPCPDFSPFRRSWAQPMPRAGGRLPFHLPTMRRIVFVLLFLSGVSLGAPAIIHLLGDF